MDWHLLSELFRIHSELSFSGAWSLQRMNSQKKKGLQRMTMQEKKMYILLSNENVYPRRVV